MEQSNETLTDGEW